MALCERTHDGLGSEGEVDGGKLLLEVPVQPFHEAVLPDVRVRGREATSLLYGATLTSLGPVCMKWQMSVGITEYEASQRL
jgi:hypothetical protein